MIQSTLYDLFSIGILRKWRKEEEEGDAYLSDFAQEQELTEQLNAQLNENQRELLVMCALAIENKLEYLHQQLQIRMFNFGVQVGMELQREFLESEDL